MGTRIGTIHANVTAKDLSWTDTMRRVREETKRTADLLQGISDRGGGLGGLGGIMPTIDIGNVINRSIGLVTDAYRKLSEAREKAEIKADKAGVLGLALDELQGLSMGAAFANTDIETVTGATTKFIKKLSEAAEGSKEARADLAMLGLTISDFQLLTTADSLRLVAERLNQMQNAGDRANVAISLFGKEAGSKMITMLGGGASAIDQYIAKAKELGIVLSDVEIAQIRFANTQSDINKLQVESTMEKQAAKLSILMGTMDDLASKSKSVAYSLGDVFLRASGYLADFWKQVDSGQQVDFGTHYDALMFAQQTIASAQYGRSSAPSPVLGSKASSMVNGQLEHRYDMLFDLLDESVKDQRDKMFKAIDDAWQEWVGVVDNPGFLRLPGGGILDMTDQIDDLKRQTEEQQKDQERSLQRQAEELARQQMQMESASSGRGGVAVYKGSEDARRLMDVSKQYQSQMAGIKRESAAERQIKENRRMEQLTQQILNELRGIKANQSNGIQALGV